MVFVINYCTDEDGVLIATNAIMVVNMFFSLSWLFKSEEISASRFVYQKIENVLHGFMCCCVKSVMILLPVSINFQETNFE